MQPQPSAASDCTRLIAIKVVHTVAWAIFAGCILAIPIASWLGQRHLAGWLIAIVACEVAVLAFNQMRCPLTAIAGKYTDDRRDNFDIYLPLWLARYNKLIFGTLYVAGSAFALAQWLRLPA